MLEEEVNAFLGRHRYQRGQTFPGYRNGYHPARELTVGPGPMAARAPRVAQVPREVAPWGFHSGVVQRHHRASQTSQRLFARLYLEGLATGDFEPVFRELVGETTALSANTVVRLKERWAHLRTSNPIESIFSGVRLRTNAVRRIRSRENALHRVFKMVERLSGNWRVLNGGEDLMALVLAGCGCEDGILKRGQVYEMAAAD